jgi:putative transposase
MARRPRVYFPGALYHIIARGNQKQTIFFDERDFRTYLSYLSEYKTKYSFYLYAFALMKNHCHLLLEVKEVPLSKIMQVLQFRYTRYFNKRYRKVGHLFQGRYKAILCDKETYLLELVRYIHLNPVRAGVVRDPEDYPWTGHMAYSRKRKENLIDAAMVLSQFSRKRSLARKQYRQFVADGKNRGHEQKYYRVKDQRFLGEDEFVEEIEGLKKSHEPSYWEVSVEKIVEEVMRLTNIRRDRLYSLTRDRQGAYGRNLVAYLARKLAGFRVKEIAQHFKREPMTISLGVMKVEKLLQQDKDFLRRVEIMEMNLREKSKKRYFITIA